MTAAKTSISKRRAVPKSSGSSDELEPLRPVDTKNDILDRERATELAVRGYPGVKR